MSSSISSSEAAAAQAPAWRAFCVLFCLVASALFIALIGTAVALDPYDTGRLALLRAPGVPEQGPRTANASRARDPAFTGAILGNSHIQLVSPGMLTAATGIPFVSLIVPGTGAKEQLLILDYVLSRRGGAVRALVLGIDGYWCTSDPQLPNWNPFPFWLYSPHLTDYVLGLVRWDTVEAIGRRIRYAAGRVPRARPDGYWDYEQYRTWRADRVAQELDRHQPSSTLNTGTRFPAIERLAGTLGTLPPELPVVLVSPPVYVTSLPQAGTPLARSERACLAALRSVADGRARTALIDWRTDRPENRRIENYFDHTHYRAPVARALEREIAEAILRLARVKPGEQG